MNRYKFIMREINLWLPHLIGREFEVVTNAVKRTAESHSVSGEEVLGTASAGPDSPSKAWLMTPVATCLSSRWWMKDSGECLISCSLS